jgi:hypothetical protein
MNPNESPVVAQPSLFKPSVTITGNREILPSSTQWLKLFLLPTHPLDALMVSLQWLWSSYSSLSIALITPVAAQVVIGIVWLFLLGCLFIVSLKEPRVKLDLIWVLISISLGICLCAL